MVSFQCNREEERSEMDVRLWEEEEEEEEEEEDKRRILL